MNFEQIPILMHMAICRNGQTGMTDMQTKKINRLHDQIWRSRACIAFFGYSWASLYTESKHIVHHVIAAGLTSVSQRMLWCKPNEQGGQAAKVTEIAWDCLADFLHVNFSGVTVENSEEYSEASRDVIKCWALAGPQSTTRRIPTSACGAAISVHLEHSDR
jgi:phosphoribosyl-AMP cyclohydrolase